ncbi:MAG: hypothetical protein ACKVW3_16425 [Phycisphaerales bacterium]
MAPRRETTAVQLSRSRPNPILDWAMGQRRDPRDLLHFLEASRASLEESLGPPRAAGRHRLARTLFFEYARGQGLSCGELAMLLGDAAKLARDALIALERRAGAESRRPRWRHVRRARSP